MDTQTTQAEEASSTDALQHEALEEALDEVLEESETQRRIRELEAEFGPGKVTDLMLDASFSEDIAAFVLEAAPRMREADARMGGKARFFMHREPNGDLYILRSLMPREWNSSYITLLAGKEEAYDRYHEELLRKIMVFPSFEETDWNYEGEPKRNAPLGLTRMRLIGTFFEYELPDPSMPHSLTFSAEELSRVETVARRTLPSL